MKTHTKHMSLSDFNKMKKPRHIRENHLSYVELQSVSKALEKIKNNNRILKLRQMPNTSTGFKRTKQMIKTEILSLPEEDLQEKINKFNEKFEKNISLYKEKQEENQDFIKQYNVIKQISKDNASKKPGGDQNDVFEDLYKRYKKIGYKFPDLSVERNLFKPSSLMMDESKIEYFYKHHKNPQVRNFSENKDLAYLSRLYSQIYEFGSGESESRKDVLKSNQKNYSEEPQPRINRKSLVIESNKLKKYNLKIKEITDKMKNKDFSEFITIPSEDETFIEKKVENFSTIKTVLERGTNKNLKLKLLKGHFSGLNSTNVSGMNGVCNASHSTAMVSNLSGSKSKTTQIPKLGVMDKDKYKIKKFQTTFASSTNKSVFQLKSKSEIETLYEKVVKNQNKHLKDSSPIFDEIEVYLKENKNYDTSQDKQRALPHHLLRTISDLKNKIAYKDVHESYSGLISRGSVTFNTLQLNKIKALDNKINNFEKYLIKSLNSGESNR